MLLTMLRERLARLEGEVGCVRERVDEDTGLINILRERLGSAERDILRLRTTLFGPDEEQSETEH